MQVEAFLGMNPGLAFATLAGGALLVGGATVEALGRFTTRNVCHARASVVGWLCMAPVLAALALGGPTISVALLAAIAVYALYELATATRSGDDPMFTRIGAAGIVAMAAAAWATGGSYAVCAGVMTVAIVATAVVPVLRDRTEGQHAGVAHATLGLALVGWGFGHAMLLAARPGGESLLLYLLFAVEVGDVAAYTTGKFLGRHHLRPAVSPNKTWEGAIGGLTAALVLPWCLRWALPGVSDVALVLVGLATGVGGQAGDLVVSAIKRDAGVKDMGSCIPGHGGVLDRIDSLVVAAPLYVLALAVATA